VSTPGSNEVARHVADGLGQLRAGDFARAEGYARAARALAPDDPDALHLHGVVLWRLGRAAEAAPLLQRAAAAAPGSAEARKNLGIVLFELHRIDEAIVCFREATRLLPQMAAAHYHLATALREKGEIDAAIAVLQRVLALIPDLREAANDLAAALKERGRIPEAVAIFQAIAARHPQDALAWINLGRCLLDYGNAAEARRAFEHALTLNPRAAAARFGKCLACLPLGYDSEEAIRASRAAYERELTALCDYYASAPPAERAVAADSGAHTLPFYLAYQGQDDRALQAKFGGLIADLQQSRYPQWSVPPPMPPREADGRLRIGVVSGFFRLHSVWKLYAGWVRRLDRRRFRVLGYSTSQRKDAETPKAHAAFDAFVDEPLPFEALATRIRADAPHVLLYPEIGMDSVTLRLAALRLAPVQCTGFGHPDTTGLPTLDVFLSSDLMEPPEADAYYTERLVRLPNTSFDYAPLDVVPLAPDLAAAGARPDAIKYLCCQSLYKYRPAHDDLFPAVAEQVPEAQFLFIEHGLSPSLTALSRARFAAAFRARGLDPARHIVFLKPLDPARYAGLNAACDIYLDSLDWSGGNTALEAIASGLPVVTLPGQFLRGRHCLAFLKRMGIGETIARSTAEYVAIAVRLGRDAAWRAEQSRRIVERRGLLYNDPEPVAALERFLLEAVEA
jgi:predicted O-linked N-acetylglucosamine transferase (SPINDLY family)